MSSGFAKAPKAYSEGPICIKAIEPFGLNRIHKQLHRADVSELSPVVFCPFELADLSYPRPSFIALNCCFRSDCALQCSKVHSMVGSSTPAIRRSC